MTPTDYNNSQAIPLHRVAVIRPFTEFLADVGAPVESHFRRLHMPFDALENVNNYLPSQFFWKFLIDMSRSQGIEELGFLVGKQFGANCVDPKMTALLSRAPTLYRGLLQASDLANRTVSNCQFGLLSPPASTYSYFYHRPSCRTINPAIEHIGWFGLMTLCAIVRAFTGPQWQPTEIGIMTNRLPGDCIGEYFPDARIKLSKPFSYIALENKLLKLPPFDKDAVSESKSVEYQELQHSFAGSLMQVLRAYSQYKYLNLSLAAELCNTSKRTLQRKLGEEGTSYKDLLDQMLLEAATRMLQDPDISITEISNQLDYSDVAHFGRAFRRITGVTPQNYRQQFKQLSKL